MSVHASDFLSETPPPRIIGTETENNIQASGDFCLADYIGPEALAAAGIPHDGGYLGAEGGSGKLHSDVGHIELSTAEQLGPASAAVADVEGIKVVTHVVDKSGNKHNGVYRTAGTFIPDGIVIDRPEERNFSGRTSGYHENYLLPRELSEDRLIDALLPTILGTRFFTMSGTLRDGGFVLSQKIWGCGGGPPVERSKERRTVSSKKPMITIPPSDKDADTMGLNEFARLEVRVGDPGMLLVGRFAGFAAVSLGLRLVELQRIVGRQRLEGISLVDPIQAAKDYAADLSLKETAPTRSGKNMTALNIQEELLVFERELAERVELPADEFLALDVIEGLIQALHYSLPEFSFYSGEAKIRMDFAARHRFIAKNLLLSEVRSNNYQAMQRNLLWDCILPKGPGLAFSEAMAAKDPLAEAIYKQANHFGPAPRSLTRGETVRRPDRVILNWTAYSDENYQAHSFGNPYGE